MKTFALVLIRVACVGWGFLELSGFLWFYSSAREAFLSLYWVMPAVALLALGLAPSGMWSNTFGRLALAGIASIAVIRSVQVVAIDLSASGGSDISSALLRAITIALLSLGMWARGRPNYVSRGKANSSL